MFKVPTYCACALHITHVHMSNVAAPCSRALPLMFLQRLLLISVCESRHVSMTIWHLVVSSFPIHILKHFYQKRKKERKETERMLASACELSGASAGIKT